MNTIGSYRALRNNAKSAMLAAIEIYNKPQIAYRNECFAILLVNAWELLLKSILSKNKQRIFYPKQPQQPYRTLTLQDSLERAKPYFPDNISYEPIHHNITILARYRNNSIHFYNQPGFDIVMYGLAQTSIVNYRDIMLAIFNIDISNEMNISLLPLGLGTQPDPIQFLQRAKENPPKSKALAQFLEEIARVTQDLDTRHLDTGRFLTVFKVNMQSIKKISTADTLVGVQPEADSTAPLYIERRIDPNISHPENQTSILKKIGNHVDGAKLGPYQFQAIVWKHDIRNKPHLCWQTGNGQMTRYAPEVITMIKKCSKQQIEEATKEYQRELKKRRKSTT